MLDGMDDLVENHSCNISEIYHDDVIPLINTISYNIYIVVLKSLLVKITTKKCQCN